MPYPKHPVLISEPDPRLHEVAAEVTEFGPELKAFTKAMQKVMLTGNATHRGAGLAAPQVGVGLRIICIEVGGATVMINPVFIPDTTDEPFTVYPAIEGCLSCFDAQYKVERFSSGTVHYQTIGGAPRTERVTAGRAQVVQHEVDHLNGITLERRALEGTATKLEKQSHG